MVQTNVLPDARLPLRLLTPSGPIFRTVNRKYFARKKHQSQDRTDVLVLRQPQKQYQEFYNIQ